jgi:regulator of replication initiation timing
MKKQDTETKLKKQAEKLDTLRNEIHNLKRQVKRLQENNQSLKESNKSLKDELKSGHADRSEEVLTEGISDIKKKLRESGLEGKTLEVSEWFVSRATGSPKK